MKTKYYIITTSIILLISLNSFTQNTFEFLLEYPVVKNSAGMVEDESGSLISIISEASGTSYAGGENTLAYILKISKDGDTLTKHYPMGDTLFYFSNIIAKENGGYLITGIARHPEAENYSLLVMEVDADLNLVWRKVHDLNGYMLAVIHRVFCLNDGYILAGFVCYFPCVGKFPYMVRIDKEGNIMYSQVYFDSTSSPRFDYMITKDTSRIWLFTSGGLEPINGGSRMVFDMYFNHLYSESVPNVHMSMFTALWHSDSAFLLSYRGQRAGAPIEDNEVCIGLYDTLFNTTHLVSFGAPDTNDYPGSFRSSDFKHYDTIFFTGFKNVDLGYPSPYAVSWIMVGQLNQNLEPRYLHFIGGDAYYKTYYIVATNDGGCVVCAGKWSPEIEVYDLLFLKLNSQGLLTGTNAKDVILKKSLLWLNAATNYLHIQTALYNANLTIYNIDGTPVMKHTVMEINEQISVGHLRAGAYIYTISTPDGYSENGKFIKP